MEEDNTIIFDDSMLSPCRCGKSARFFVEQPNGELQVYAVCMECGIRTPSIGAGLEYSAVGEVARVWNAGTTLWPRWIQPAKAEDGYDIGAQVSYDSGQGFGNEHWVSTVNDNVWKPGDSGWRLSGY